MRSNWFGLWLHVHKIPTLSMSPFVVLYLSSNLQMLACWVIVITANITATMVTVWLGLPQVFWALGCNSFVYFLCYRSLFVFPVEFIVLSSRVLIHTWSRLSFSFTTARLQIISIANISIKHILQALKLQAVSIPQCHAAALWWTNIITPQSSSIYTVFVAAPIFPFGDICLQK